MKSFQPFHLDESGQTLWRGLEEVPLTRKAAALLRCLVDRAGRPVEKADIIREVWPDTHVHPDNVKVLVREIRLALGDDVNAPTFIRSAPGLGYTFIAPVTETRDAYFVGRTRELTTLVGALDDVRAGSPRALLVTGERGAGKSRLCEIFLRMTGAVSALRSCRGECHPGSHAEDPLAPFVQALAHLERQAPAVVRGLLESHWPSWLARTAAGANSGHAAHRQGAADELIHVLHHLSRHLPLVIVIEGLEWAHPATLDAMHELSQQRGPAKWLLIGTCCPGTGSTRPFQAAMARLAAQRRVKTLALGRLTEIHVRRYLDERLGPGRLSSVAPAMTAVTGGNPGMLVKAVDELIRHRFLSADDDGWQAALIPKALESVLPEMLNGMFKDEVAALDAPSRAALEIASLAGATFTSTAVATAWDAAVEDVEQLFAPLARRGHIIRTRPGSPFGYAFRHTAYADLLAREAPFAQQVRAAAALEAGLQDLQLLRA